MIECNTYADEHRLYIEVKDDYRRPHYRKISHHLTDLDLVTAEAYLQSLVNHIQYVREAGEKIGVDGEQLAAHDDSKWSHEEFVYYALNFHGKESGLDAAHRQGSVSDGFANAWLHHIHHNRHHWQHWMFPDGFTPKGSSVENGIVYMPPAYALEMIADWMGASMAYTGSWDMVGWLHQNMPRIKLHSKTADYVRGILDMLGYADTVYMQRFGHEES